MVTKEQIDKHVAKARTYLGRATATQEESVIVAIADENDRLRADNAKLLATLEHSATHKALDALAKENATLRAQLAEEYRRGVSDALGVFDRMVKKQSVSNKERTLEVVRDNLAELLTLPAPPSSDQDVRAALADAILEADGDATAYGIADAILSDPLLGKLLRGGR